MRRVGGELPHVVFLRTRKHWVPWFIRTLCVGTDNATLQPINKFSDFAVKILKSVGGERVANYSDLLF